MGDGIDGDMEELDLESTMLSDRHFAGRDWAPQDVWQPIDDANSGSWVSDLAQTQADVLAPSVVRVMAQELCQQASGLRTEEVTEARVELQVLQQIGLGQQIAGRR